ncbi:hypothetical protein C8Q77DRAFT_1268748 [Trametes polyzona]|nr:hypothetical protein C8Q77DRAFT_1268748 [Trametes polyzona]
MPTYYLQPGQHAHIQYQRPRAYSQSAYAPQPVVYTHSGSSHHSSPQRRATVYPQQSGAYYASPQYLTPNYQYDTGRHHHHQGHARSGSGGVYYASSAPSHYHDASSRSSPSSQRRSASHSRHHRSQSVPRTAQMADSRSHHHRVSWYPPQSSSRPRQSPPVHTHRDRRSSESRPVGEPLSERIRRMFGFGGHSRSQHRDYVDARSGRTVDWRGRPIYRV